MIKKYFRQFEIEYNATVNAISLGDGLFKLDQLFNDDKENVLKFIETLNVNEYHLTFLLGILGTLFPHRNDIKEWVILRDSVKEMIIEQGKDANGLMVGFL